MLLITRLLSKNTRQTNTDISLCRVCSLWQANTNLSSVAAVVDEGKTGAAVFSSNVTFVDGVVSAWEDMSTVMFVHPRLNGSLLLLTCKILSVSSRKLFVFNRKYPDGLKWEKTKETGTIPPLCCQMSYVSRHGKYLQSLPTLLDNYTIEDKREEWESMSFRKQAL